MSTPTTTPTAAGRPAPSTRPAGRSPLRASNGRIEVTPAVRIGSIVLVRIDTDCVRPLLITRAERVDVYARTTPLTPAEAPQREYRVCGTIFAEPDDHTRPGFRGWAAGGADPAKITGRPDRLLPLGYGEWLAPGAGIGQWQLIGGQS